MLGEEIDDMGPSLNGVGVRRSLGMGGRARRGGMLLVGEGGPNLERPLTFLSGSTRAKGLDLC